MPDLGTLSGAFATIAPCCHTINNRGEVVGFSIDGNGSTAFLWIDGVIRDLNALIPADSPLHLLSAESMNDAGEITGQGCVMPACTEMHAYRAHIEVAIDHWMIIEHPEVNAETIDRLPRFGISMRSPSFPDRSFM
jgi:probable HAF family extracellular repeat protein